MHHGLVRLLVAASVVVFAASLFAVVDTFVHPETPYLDVQRLVIGAAFGVVAAILVFVYLSKLQRSETRGDVLEERLRQLVENMGEVFWLANADRTRFTYISPGADAIWGTHVTDTSPRPMDFVAAIHPDDRPALLRDLERQLSGDCDGASAQEYRLDRPDGGVRWIRNRFVAIRDRRGNLQQFGGISADITDRKAAEAALRRANDELEVRVRERTEELTKLNEVLRSEITERTRSEEMLGASEARFRDLVESAPDALVLINDEGKIILVNARAESMFGHSRLELIGQPIELLVPQRYRENHPAWRDRCFQEPSNRPIGVASMLHGLRKDGSEFPVEIALSRITGDGSHLAAVRDVSDRVREEEERRALEIQVQHAQKLEGLGMLAGGIAHDLNNLLAGVLNYANLALSRMQPEAAARGPLEEIKIAVHRMSELGNQMLSYARRGRVNCEPVDLSRVIAEMADLLESSISKKTVLRFELSEQLPAIEADCSQLQQVIMNTVVNASEALGEESGVVTLRTGVIEAGRGLLSRAYIDDGLPEGAYVCLEVSDTGCGMDPQMQARIFDPFFTTKQRGQGLGLSAVLGIVRRHGGMITIESQPGSGATFLVLFPPSTRPEAGLPPESRSAEPRPSRRRATILLVDDERAVRRSTKMLLEEAGLVVLTGVDGREALELFSERSNEIDLVVLDLSMPELDGEEVFGELRHTRPDLPVILCSGYSDHDPAERWGEPGLTDFVAKPYEVAALLDKIDDMLKQRA